MKSEKVKKALNYDIAQIWILADNAKEGAELSALISHYINESVHVLMKLEDTWLLDNAEDSNYVMFLSLQTYEKYAATPDKGKILDKSLLIMISERGEDAVKSFEYGAISFLLSPYRPEQVKRVCDNVNKIFSFKAIKQPEKKESLLQLGIIVSFLDDKYILNRLESVFYFSCENGKTYVKTENGSYLVKHSLSRLEQSLDPNIFIRCQKSYIVNIHYIKSIDTWFNQTLLINLDKINERIPVSRMYYSRFKKMLLD